jgi:hypothetical protein
MAVACVLVVTILTLGNWWWNAQAAEVKQAMLYHAPALRVSFDGTGQLILRMDEDFWHKSRENRWSMTLIPDHGHLMHAFLLRVPAMDRFYHLHPQQTNDGSFLLRLPTIPSGKYKIFPTIGSTLPLRSYHASVLHGFPFRSEDDLPLELLLAGTI